MADLFEEEVEYIEPNPASIIESLRSIGYTMETAIADLIDNSITAQATTINIDSPFSGANTKIFILDDGIGMSEQTIGEKDKCWWLKYAIDELYSFAS